MSSIITTINPVETTEIPVTTTAIPVTTTAIPVTTKTKSTSNLMIGSITLSAIHLILSLILFQSLIINPRFLNQNQDYIQSFIYISMIFNIGIFIFCWRCKNSHTEMSDEHTKLMNLCIILSAIHFFASFLMLSSTSSSLIMSIFLVVSIIINSLIIYLSNACNTLYHH